MTYCEGQMGLPAYLSPQDSQPEEKFGSTETVLLILLTGTGP